MPKSGLLKPTASVSTAVPTIRQGVKTPGNTGEPGSRVWFRTSLFLHPLHMCFSSCGWWPAVGAEPGLLEPTASVPTAVSTTRQGRKKTPGNTGDPGIPCLAQNLFVSSSAAHVLLCDVDGGRWWAVNAKVRAVEANCVSIYGCSHHTSRCENTREHGRAGIPCLV